MGVDERVREKVIIPCPLHANENKGWEIYAVQMTFTEEDGEQVFWSGCCKRCGGELILIHNKEVS